MPKKANSIRHEPTPDEKNTLKHLGFDYVGYVGKNTRSSHVDAYVRERTWKKFVIRTTVHRPRLAADHFTVYVCINFTGRHKNQKVFFVKNVCHFVPLENLHTTIDEMERKIKKRC